MSQSPANVRVVIKIKPHKPDDGFEAVTKSTDINVHVNRGSEVIQYKCVTAFLPLLLTLKV